MKAILYSICIGSLALALTAWGEQASDTTTVEAKAKKQAAVSTQGTTSAKTGARTSGKMAGTRSHRRANVSAVHAKVNVNDTTRFTNVTRITANAGHAWIIVTAKGGIEGRMVETSCGFFLLRNSLDAGA